jgi:hypothetical protein
MSDDRTRAQTDQVADEPPELSERFLAAMELSETPEQQEVARAIYDRLAAGADVDEVRPLIDEMMTIVVRQRHGQPAVPPGDDGSSYDRKLPR